MNGEPDILTLDEAAAYLRISVSTLRRRMVEGRALPFRYVGRRPLFSRDLLKRWIEGADGGCQH